MSNEITTDEEYEDSVIVEEGPEEIEIPIETEVNIPLETEVPEPGAPKPQKKKKAFRKVTVELPKCKVDEESYVGRSRGRIDIELKGNQRASFRRIYSGLREKGATLENGKLVDSAGDVVRWIFEQAHEPKD